MSIQLITDGVDAVHEALKADLTATPEGDLKEPIENLKAAYRDHEDGTEAWNTLDSYLKGLIENVDPADPLAFPTVATLDRHVRENVAGQRGRKAKEAAPVLEDVASGRGYVLAQTILSLADEVENEFVRNLAVAVEEVVSTWDGDDLEDAEARLTKAATDGLAAITKAPTAGSGGGTPADRDVSPIAGQSIPVYVEHKGDRLDGVMTCPEDGDQTDVTVTDENGTEHTSLSAFGAAVTKYSVNGWKKVRRAEDGATIDSICPEV